MGLLLVLPSVSYAGKMSVQFDFSSSSLSILGGFINVPPDGTIIAGSGQIDVGAAGIATPGGGAAALKNLSLSATLNKNGFGVIITGAVGANQSGTATGSLSGGLGNLAFNPFGMGFTGFANCANTGTGTGCTILGLPTTLTSLKTFSIPSLAVANLGTVGNAVVNGSFTFTLGGFTAVLSLVGNEVSRSFIPEPNTFGLLAMGMAGLSALRLATVRRRRRP